MNDRVKRVIRHWWWTVPLALAAAAYFLLPLFPAVTETVATGGLFRALSAVIGWPVQWLPFSLTECLVVLGIPAALSLLVLGIVRFVRSPHKKAIAAAVGRGTAAVLSVLLLWYMLLHGVNFYRRPLSDLMGLTVRPHSTAELAKACVSLLAEAETARAALPENEDGTARLPKMNALLSTVGDGYDTLSKTYPFLWGATRRVKPVSLSYAWSYTGISGMYFPFFAEANVNIDQPKWCVPFTAAHELAHTRGFAREDECNFLGFLACAASDDVGIRYSGYYMAYIYCHNALTALDPDKAAAVGSLVSDGMRRDLQAQHLYWKHFEGPVRDVSDAVNDGFISSQGVPDGVYSYGRCVDLILAWGDKS